MVTDWKFAWAFARQACSDLKARDVLLRDVQLPECHQLHFLQMACEKICKAHLLRTQETVEKKHSYIAGPLPEILDFQLMLENMSRSSRRYLRKEYKRIANEIEVLAPAVTKDGKRHDNTEYPWKDELNRVCVPMDFAFGGLSLQKNPGPQFLAVLHRAAERLELDLKRKVLQQPEVDNS